MMIVARLARGITDHFPARASEWALGVILFLWGVQLLRPVYTFQGQSYAELQRLLPEDLWGLACILIGAARLLALIVNGSVRHSPMVRAIMAGFSALFWLQISIAFLMSSPNGTALAVYPVLFALDCYNVLRAASEAGARQAKGR